MLDRNAIDRALKRLSDIEAQLATAGPTTSRSKTYRPLLLEHRRLRRLAEKAEVYFQLQRDAEECHTLLADAAADPELRQLAKNEITSLETRLTVAEKDLHLALLPPDPREERNAIMEIRSGTGGNEAALFAGDLFRMYTKYIQRQGWKLGVLDAHPGEMGGYKEIVFSVEGEGVYGVLRYESGGHRVQRIPATESQGRIHTSAATVAVFPEVEEEDDIEIKPEDIRVDIFCASGPGGQGVNTTYSAVRVTHRPTGLVAQCQDERSQHRNKDRALAVLKARLLDRRRREQEETMAKTRRVLIGSGDRNERIRTYNFPQNRVTDHRINLTLYKLDRIMEGEIGDILVALRTHDLEQRLLAESKALNG